LRAPPKNVNACKSLKNEIKLCIFSKKTKSNTKTKKRLQISKIQDKTVHFLPKKRSPTKKQKNAYKSVKYKIKRCIFLPKSRVRKKKTYNKDDESPRR